MVRSSCPEVFCRKGVLKTFGKLRGKHLCQTLIFNKVADKRLWHWCFAVNFTKLLRTPFFIEHLWWLLLDSMLSSNSNKKLKELIASNQVLTFMSSIKGTPASWKKVFFDVLAMIN